MHFPGSLDVERLRTLWSRMVTVGRENRGKAGLIDGKVVRPYGEPAD